jgi:hypothetical protein
MNINNAFPSKWLKSGDVEEDDLILTISRVAMEDIGQGENQENKPVLYFEETEKGMVLNKTNAEAISRLHTPETDNWIGKKIAIFATEVDFAGKQTLALRVRMKAPKIAQQKPQPAITEKKTFNMAHLVFDVMTPDQWHTKAAQFCHDNPNWLKDGKPDLNHVLASAGQAGYETITADNIADVFDTIVGLHAQKSQA